MNVFGLPRTRIYFASPYFTHLGNKTTENTQIASHRRGSRPPRRVGLSGVRQICGCTISHDGRPGDANVLTFFNDAVTYANCKQPRLIYCIFESSSHAAFDILSLYRRDVVFPKGKKWMGGKLINIYKTGRVRNKGPFESEANRSCTTTNRQKWYVNSE